MNAASICLVCNQSFPVPSSKQSLNLLYKIEDLKKVEECFATNFGLSPEERASVSFCNKPNIYPFCPGCTTTTLKLITLQTTLTKIENKLASTRREIATMIVNTYANTIDDCPFFRMKTLIFQKWYRQVEEDCAEQEIAEISKSIKQEIAEASSSSRVSREVAGLKRKGKGDIMPISIDDQEVEEVTCPVCNKVYRSKEYLNLHMKSHSGGTRPFECPYCGKSFFGGSTLKKHLSTKHPRKKSINVKTFPPIETEVTKVTMEGGQEAHLIIGKSVEEDMEMDTPSPAEAESDFVNLSNFLDITDDEPSFEDKMDLEQTFGTNASAVNCEHCGKTFASKVTRTKHIRTVHLKTIKVQCPLCPMTTRDHYNLTKHVLNHNPLLTKLTYNCPLCGEGFRVRKELCHHYRSNHKLRGAVGHEFPSPIIRALEEHEESNMVIDADTVAGVKSKQPGDESLSAFVPDACLSDTSLINEPCLSDTSLVNEPCLSDTSLINEACKSDESEISGIIMVDKASSQIEALPNVEIDAVEPELPFSLETMPPEVVESTESLPLEAENVSIPVVAGVPKPNEKKPRRKKRKKFLTYMPRSKLIKQRMRLEAIKPWLPVKFEPVPVDTSEPSFSSSAEVEPEIQKGCSILLTIPCTESPENDKVLVEEAQMRVVAFEKLNFNMRLEMEKVQSVMCSLDGVEEEELLGKVGVPAENSLAATAVPPPIKIYGPKSKLGEIRARKMRAFETVTNPSVDTPALTADSDDSILTPPDTLEANAGKATPTATTVDLIPDTAFISATNVDPSAKSYTAFLAVTTVDASAKSDTVSVPLTAVDAIATPHTASIPTVRPSARSDTPSTPLTTVNPSAKSDTASTPLTTVNPSDKSDTASTPLTTVNPSAKSDTASTPLTTVNPRAESDTASTPLTTVNPSANSDTTSTPLTTVNASAKSDTASTLLTTVEVCTMDTPSPPALPADTNAKLDADAVERPPMNVEKIRLRLAKPSSPNSGGRRREVWINASKVKKVKVTKPVSQLLATLSPDGKKVLLKKIITTQPKPQQPVNPSAKTARPGPTSNLSQALPILTSQLQSSNTTTTTTTASNVSTRTIVTTITNRCLPPTRYPLPNQQLAQIALSIKKRQRKPISVAKDGAVQSFMSNSGPIIESTRSLAGEPAQAKAKSRTEFIKVTAPGTSKSATAQNREMPSKLNTSSMPAQTASQIQALLRNSNIDVTFVEAESTETISVKAGPSKPMPTITQTLKHKLPPGIRLVQVEDVLKGKRPSSSLGANKILSPEPKRRFVLSKLGKLGKLHAASGAKPAISLSSLGPAVVKIPAKASASSASLDDSYQSDAGPIRLRSLSSILDQNVDMEETEEYRPDLIEPAPPQVQVPVSLASNGRPPISIVAKKVTGPTHTNALYRPFPKNETTHIRTYSEHMRIRLQQQQQQQQQSMSVALETLTVTPPTMRAPTIYIGIQPPVPTLIAETQQAVPDTLRLS